MKIGIMGTRGIPNEYGGFEQMTEYLSRGLAERGHEVSVYNPHHHSYRNNRLGEVRIIHRYDPASLGAAGQFIYDLNCINDARRRNYDILLHLGYTSDAIWSFRWPGKTIHLVNMDGMEWKRTKYNTLTRRFLEWSESLVAKKATHLVADSRGIKDHLLTRYGKEASYIPYCAEVFNPADPSVPRNFGCSHGEYSLVIARMEPENNIDLVIDGHLETSQALLVIGNIGNRFGRQLQRKYRNPLVRFYSPVYDKRTINSLRFFSKIYFHGHSVGGTNPSLLEAMACGCRIAAHDNIFNKAVLGDEGEYFSSAKDIFKILSANPSPEVNDKNKKVNLHKILTTYSPGNMVTAYENLMTKSLIRHPVSSHQIVQTHL